MVAEVKRRTGHTLNSCYRGADAHALLRSLGKSDQAYLYWGWQRRLPGFNPANPPGFSPHECHSDGVSPPGFSRGAVIPEELCGQDWEGDASVIAAYRAMGVAAYHPYSDSREQHHVGIAQVPKRQWFGVPKLGTTQIQNVWIKRRLAWCVRPHANGARYWPIPDRSPRFTHTLDKVVKEFQRDHGINPDGVVGPITMAQLTHAADYWKAKTVAARKAKPGPKLPKPVKPPPPKPPAPVAHDVAGPLFGPDVYVGEGDVDWKKVRG